MMMSPTFPLQIKTSKYVYTHKHIDLLDTFIDAANLYD